jgi:hypothetical protein
MAAASFERVTTSELIQFVSGTYLSQSPVVEKQILGPLDCCLWRFRARFFMEVSIYISLLVPGGMMAFELSNAMS